MITTKEDLETFFGDLAYTIEQTSGGHFTAVSKKRMEDCDEAEKETLISEELYRQLL